MKKEDIALENFHKKIIRGFIEKIRPPAHIRDQVDIDYTFQNRVLEIFEIRPL